MPQYWLLFAPLLSAGILAGGMGLWTAWKIKRARAKKAKR